MDDLLYDKRPQTYIQTQAQKRIHEETGFCFLSFKTKPSNMVWKNNAIICLIVNQIIFYKRLYIDIFYTFRTIDV